jgi:phospholipase C
MTTPGLGAIDHIVVLMLENRSLDHMLGYLYQDSNNVSPAGQPFEGLTGKESCPGPDGRPVTVYPIDPGTPNAYFMPGADPGEGYQATNDQLYGSSSTPTAGEVAPMTGFVTDYATAIPANQSKGWYVVPGTTANMIMGCYTPQTLPVLSGLARGFAVCDHWFASAPTQTLPNRAFVCAGTSEGHMDDKTKAFTVPSIFGQLTRHGVPWKIYGYTQSPLTKSDFPDTKSAPSANFGKFADFKADAKAGNLPAYAFLEPSWSSTGNSQHPNYNVALGEQLLLDTYQAVRSGANWNSTLLIITYDEHGGCYDHVSPPWGATPPDNTPGEYGFDFTRFGPRVPTVLVSPLIPAGTVFRVPDGTTPLDHTSILATVEHRWSVPALTRRDAAAPDVAGALTLTTPRTDDPLSTVSAPPPPPIPAEMAAQPSHLQQVHAALLAAQAPGAHVAGSLADLHTNEDYRRYIDEMSAREDA